MAASTFAGFVSSGLHHEVALVAHDAAHLEALRPREVGEASGVFGVAAAPGQADVDVDQHLADPASRGGVDRRFGVDRDGDPRRLRARQLAEARASGA